MTDLPRCPYDRHPEEHYLTLDSWMTPAFCQFWLDHGGLADKPLGHQSETQLWRYFCIANRRDWTGGERELVWREPRQTGS